MAGIYIYSDQRDIVAELVTFAKKTEEPCNILVCTESEAQNYKYLGADNIILLKGETDLVEGYAKPIAGLLEEEGADLFVVGATPRGRDLAAKVAGFIDCGMVSDVSAITYEEGHTVTERLIFGGAVVQNESFSDLGVVTIPPGRFKPSGAIEAESPIKALEVQADTRISTVSVAPITREGVDLTAAEKIVCIGMGFDSEDDMEMARELAEVIGAELGCTRSIAEDRHWLPVDRYIGLSGVVVKPELYIGIAVSGQIQHAVGARDSKIIVAINTDENAPIFTACDYGIVADMREVIPLLINALK